MGFPEAPLGDLVELKRGYDLPTARRRPGTIPVVSSSGIQGSHDTARVRGPGVVTGRTGTLGKVSYLEADFWPLNTTLYVRDFKGNDPRFVSYLLRTLDYEIYNDKGVISGVNRRDLHRVFVPRPPLDEQRRIARTLAAIERRARLLAQLDECLAAMADTLFELRATSPVPLAELCTRIGNGATPPGRSKRGGPVLWFRSGELRDGPLLASETTIEDGRIWPEHTVLLAMYAAPTVGRLGLLACPAAVNQACCAMVGPRPFTLFSALRAARARLAAQAVGAVQQNLSLKVLRGFPVDVPADDAFEREVAPLWRQRIRHAREQRKLEELLASLTPALVAGGF